MADGVQQLIDFLGSVRQERLAPQLEAQKQQAEINRFVFQKQLEQEFAARAEAQKIIEAQKMGALLADAIRPPSAAFGPVGTTGFQQRFNPFTEQPIIEEKPISGPVAPQEAPEAIKTRIRADLQRGPTSPLQEAFKGSEVNEARRQHIQQLFKSGNIEDGNKAIGEFLKERASGKPDTPFAKINPTELFNNATPESKDRFLKAQESGNFDLSLLKPQKDGVEEDRNLTKIEFLRLRRKLQGFKGVDLENLVYEDMVALAEATGFARQTGKERAKPTLGEAQRSLSAIEGLERVAQRIVDNFDPKFVGKIDFLLGAGREFFDTASPEEIVFRKDVLDLSDRLLRARSGAQINEQEFQRLSRIIAKLSDPNGVFEVTARRFLFESQQLKKSRLKFATTPKGKLRKGKLKTFDERLEELMETMTEDEAFDQLEEEGF